MRSIIHRPGFDWLNLLNFLMIGLLLLLIPGVLMLTFIGAIFDSGINKEFSRHDKRGVLTNN